jgi:hypothetical protein
MKMEPMDGVDTARAIREFDKRVQIVALTAYGNEYRVRENNSLGVGAWIAKPLLKRATREKLVDAVERAAVEAGFPSRYFVLQLLDLKDELDLVRVRQELLESFGQTNTEADALFSTGSLDLLAELISQRIMGLVATYAHRAVFSDRERVPVAVEGRFTDEIGRALVERLPIDLYRAPELLTNLLAELRALVTIRGVSGDWGRLWARDEDMWIAPSVTSNTN